MFLEISQNSQESTCARVSFLIKLQAAPATLLKRTLAQVFSYEFCEISKNTFFTEHLRTTASVVFLLATSRALEIPGQIVKSVQSLQESHQKNVTDIIMVSLLLNLIRFLTLFWCFHD